MSVDELMQSKRLEIAVKFFKEDPMLLKTIFIELGREAQNVAKHTMMREFKRHEGLDWFLEMRPYLSQYNDFCTYNIWWTMNPQEKLYYSENPKDELPQEEAWKLFKSKESI